MKRIYNQYGDPGQSFP